jgi:DNA-binding PadR family transcriptional regulator
VARRRFSNLLALAVLSCLNERPMHPYEISQNLRQRGKDQSIKLNYGALYGVVESLTKAGLIEPRETVREGKRPERTVYAITEAGAQEHDEWLEDLIATPVRDYHSLEAALALMAGLAPDQVVRALEDRSVKLRVELASVEESLRIVVEMKLPEIFSIEAEFRRALLRAELDFVQALAERMRTDALTGVAGWRRVHELIAEGMTLEQIFRDPVAHLGPDGEPFVPFVGGSG